ncbi:hypothetical protein CAPTEDRAFT_168178 [Capitella teleta]|uniref:Arf-GAP with coiled-coil, ANK repeat and PH domain-containing protein 2 n=1 Tax=Capitella teleta TaxID=283909 RepID=R7VIY0_CAPTE|nr:hypothetical protein CAPTEDRAFT_168178 [Capitella teleta]|eukprot:ELU18512.1 hypothetical protein CAPTEDRAFT_168178 [Capitella teleta]
MRPNIEFNECLKDSPRFRASLEEAEGDVDLLEVKLDKLVKVCSQMIEVGKAFSNANSAFIVGARDVAELFKDEDLLSAALAKFTNMLAELQKYNNILLDQAHRSICKNLQSFIKTEIRKVKETRKHFEKISDDLDNALVRNAQAPRSKPLECEEANNVLTAMNSCFTHVSLDYVFQINVLHSRKRFDVLDTMLAFMHAQNAYFHQGSDLFEDMEPYFKRVATQIEDLNSKGAIDQRNMEQKHTQVQQKVRYDSAHDSVRYDFIVECASEDSTPLRMEGYLFKRTSNAFKTWVRRWFTVQNNQLVYRKRSRDSVTIMEDDLRLCTVRLVSDVDRRFCFEVLSPSRSHILQADSDQECVEWVAAIQRGVSHAYNERSDSCAEKPVTSNAADVDAQSSSSSDVEQQTSKPRNKRLEMLLAVPGNDKCCDCGSPDPRWSSINLGITLCIECSGIHRSFGVQVSKVRSMTLDSWEPELVKVMLELGNTAVNRVYEHDVDESVHTRATPHCARDVRESWIRAKYMQKAFLRKLLVPDSQNSPAKRWSVQKPKRRTAEDGTVDLEESVESDTESEMDAQSTTSTEDLTKLQPNFLLYKAVQARNLAVMMEALALGADPNWRNPDEHGTTPLIQAVSAGCMAPTEFLLLNATKVNVKDDRGQSPLHHATLHGHTGQVCQLLKRSANQHAVDENGQDALAIAVSTANADIVTLLRLSKLNEEMKEVEGIYGTSGDETFNEVFRDFTNMANNAPEKLQRNK